MQNPKVMQAFQDLMSGPGGPMGLMSNPAKLQEMMADPEVRDSLFNINRYKMCHVLQITNPLTVHMHAIDNTIV